VDNFQSSAHGHRDHRQPSVKCLYENNAERFGLDIRLAKDVRSCQKARNIRSLAEKTYTIADSRAHCAGLEFLEISGFARPLTATHHPTNPIGDRLQPAKGLKKKALPLPTLQSTGLNDDRGLHRGTEDVAELMSQPITMYGNGRRYRQVKNFARHVREQIVQG